MPRRGLRLRRMPVDAAQWRVHFRIVMATESDPPLVSIITPTHGRARFLPALARSVARQTVAWEWQVLDDSPEPDAWMQQLAQRDPRVHYRHVPARLTIGAKRSQLVAASRGQLIAHFDDDDYYAPDYLQDMTHVLAERDADLVKLSAFCMYAPAAKLFGYMDLAQPNGRHYLPAGERVREVEPRAVMHVGDDFVLCYGFSYVYRRALGTRTQFADISLGEDDSFVRAVVKAGHRVAAVPDARQGCLHVVHPGSTSYCFARYRMPPYLLARLFPDYEGYPG